MTTRLRQRMIEDMQLRGLAERTQEVYVAAVRQLAEHYGKSPDQISDQDLRQYFLYLTNEKKASSSAITIALCAIKFLYERTLHQEWPMLTLVRPPRERRLPVVLSREEVHRILGRLRRPYYLHFRRSSNALALTVSGMMRVIILVMTLTHLRVTGSAPSDPRKRNYDA